MPETFELATVKFYKPDAGYGFVTGLYPQSPDAFVNYQALDAAGINDLQRGDQVEVVIVESTKGLKVAKIRVPAGAPA